MARPPDADTDTSIPDARHITAQLTGMLLPPLATLAGMQVAYGVVDATCRTGRHDVPAVHVVRLVTHYAPLLLGCTLACALYTRLGHRMLAAVSAPPMAALAALGAVAITLNEPTAAGLIGFQVAVAVIVAYVVLRPHRLAARALSVRPALFIAAISYPLYLFHSFGFKAAALVLTRDDGPASALHLLMCLAVAIPACWLLHRWVEKPMQDLGRRLTRRPRPAEARVPELVTT